MHRRTMRRSNKPESYVSVGRCSRSVVAARTILRCWNPTRLNSLDGNEHAVTNCVWEFPNFVATYTRGMKSISKTHHSTYLICMLYLYVLTYFSEHRKHLKSRFTTWYNVGIIFFHKTSRRDPGRTPAPLTAAQRRRVVSKSVFLHYRRAH